MYTISNKIKFYKKVFGNINVSHDFKNVSVKCPFCCKDNKKKLAIKVDSDIMHCWICGFKARNLVPILKKFSSQNLLNEYINDFYKSLSTFSNIVDEKTITLPKDFTLLALCKKNDPDVNSIKFYLKNRGLTDRDLWYYKFGYSNNGLFYRRVIFPSFDVGGNLNFYSARSIDDKFPKYLNSDVKKTEIIFNQINIDWSKPLTLVEGPFDLAKCDENATCILGSTFSEDSLLFIEIIKHETPVILALDSDNQKMQNKIAKKLSSYNVDVKILSLNGKKDVGEMLRNEFIKAKKFAKKWDNMRLISDKIKCIKSKVII
jgi:hypothetical protein